MNGFKKYEEMRCKGASPREVFLAAKADELDAITQIRLLRQVFGFSLAEAKQVITDANEVWSAKQTVAPGTVVSWEGWSTEEGFYIMQARVRHITGNDASLEDHKKFLVTDEGIKEVPVEGPRMASLEVSYLERPLSTRLEKLLEFVESLSHLSDDEKKRKVV